MDGILNKLIGGIMAGAIVLLLFSILITYLCAQSDLDLEKKKNGKNTRKK